MKPLTTGWILGFFVAMLPIHFNFDGTGLSGLFMGIYGVTGAILLEWLS